MYWIVMPSVGSCRLLQQINPGSGPSAGSITIVEAVGEGPRARNRPADVRTVQEALNQVTVKGVAGGAMPFLVVDGICGPKTNAAIGRFQRIQLQIFDGVIEPRKKTITRLNEIVEPISEEDMRAKLSLALPLVQQAVAAALNNLQALIASGPAPTGLAAKAVDRLNRHFLMDTLPRPEQSAARVDLFRTFTRYSAVVSKSGTFTVEPLDEFDLAKDSSLFALARTNGFFEEGQTDENTRRRLDRIHLGQAFFTPTVTPEFGAFILLHEVSHFVGRADGQFIVDHGRGWFNDRFIRPLSADQRLANADSYASFAHECRVESPAKPAFVQTSAGGLAGAR
jgi:peptidoglycan hydrolase-like protein with peptidoglycan-binding domain